MAKISVDLYLDHDMPGSCGDCQFIARNGFMGTKSQYCIAFQKDLDKHYFRLPECESSQMISEINTAELADFIMKKHKEKNRKKQSIVKEKTNGKDNG